MKSLTLCFGVIFILGQMLSVGGSTMAQGQANPQLIRVPYVSAVDKSAREFFVYLPIGYAQDTTKKWPVLMFLHGDGERGDTKEDLDYLLSNGPLYEAWIQKRDLPFIIVSPQLWLFGRDKTGPEYLTQRTREQIPQRLAEGVPPHNADMPALQWAGPMKGAVAAEAIPPFDLSIVNTMWDKADPDVINILTTVLSEYRADKGRVYLTGVSLGGMGTWYYAAKYPDYFAALVPVVGYGTVAQAEAIGKARIPVWAFSGGRDVVVQTQYFFPAMNKLEAMGAEIRFTTEQDMYHDVWNRVYAGEDVYNWLLSHMK